MGRGGKASLVSRFTVTALLATACLLTAGTATAEGSSTPGLRLAGVWAPLPKGAPKKANVVFGSISCTSSTSCVAVGIYTTFHSGKTGTFDLIETLRGRTWKAIKAPLPANAAANAYQTLEPVSCASAHFCVAVGSYYDRSGALMSYIEVFSGGRWRAWPAPLPAGASSRIGGILEDISCPSSSSCEAVGHYPDGPYRSVPYLVTMTGHSWRARTAPLPSNARWGTSLVSWTPDNLESVACSSPRDCEAIGTYYAQGVGNGIAYLETLSAGKWTAHATAVPSGGSLPNSLLTTVSCPPSGPCEAGGGYAAQGGKPEGFFETLSSGSEPVASALPMPARASRTNPGSVVLSVSCPASGSCVALTHIRSSSGRIEAFLARQTADSWDQQLAPVPAPDAKDSRVIVSIACGAKSFCVGVGSFNSRAGGQELVDALSSNRWTPWQAKLPTAVGRAGAALQQVSCGSPTVCYAIGSYNNNKGLLETIRRG